MNQIFWCLFILFVCGVVCFFDLFIRATLFKNKYQDSQGGFISEVDLDEVIEKYKSLCLVMRNRAVNLKKDLKQCRETNKCLKDDMQSILASSMKEMGEKKVGVNHKNGNPSDNHIDNLEITKPPEEDDDE